MLTYLLSIALKAACLILGISTPGGFPPPLDAEAEKRLFEAFFETGDEKAREKLILHNLRLVSHIVRKYYSGAKDSEDLVSIGTMGLIKAVDSFKPSSGVRFATYGARCIQNEILMHFRAQKKIQAEVSLGDTIDVDKDGNPLTYIDVMSSDENVCEEVERKIQSDRARRLVDSILSVRERKIIQLRYGLSGGEPLTQREVAQLVGISRSYVSRIEKSALETLRQAMG